MVNRYIYESTGKVSACCPSKHFKFNALVTASNSMVSFSGKGGGSGNTKVLMNRAVVMMETMPMGGIKKYQRLFTHEGLRYSLYLFIFQFN
jgi:hypothetical protein